MNDGRSGKGLSEKEAALIAAARRELGEAPAPSAPPPVRTIAAKIAPKPATAAVLPAKAVAPVMVESAYAHAPQQAIVPPPKPDTATRMAMLLESERIAAEDRKRRIRRNYMVVLATIMLAALIYVVVNLLRILTG
jgi:hypothetical protein